MANFYPFLYFACAALIFISGALVLANNPKSRVNQKYALLCLAILSWILTYGIALSLRPYEKFFPLILFLHKIGYTGVIFIAATLWDYILTFFRIDNYRKIGLGYLVCISLAILIWSTSYIIDGFYIYQWGVYPKAGPFHPCFLIIFSLIIAAIYIDNIKEIRNRLLSPQRNNQAKYLLLSYAILNIGCIDFIPNYGVGVYPTGPIFTTLFLLIIAYTIIKYQLMDIKIVLSKSLVYSLLITAMTILYFLSIFLSERILQSIVGYKTFLGSLIASLILAFTFIPLKNYFQKLVDKIILGKTPAEMAEENILLQQELTRREKYKMAAALAGGVAHEIKNPLTAIGTFIEQFPDKKDDPEFLGKFHRLATQELSRVRELSAQLMDFAKPAELKLSKFEVHSLLNDVLMLMNSRLKHQDINLNKQFSLQPLTLTADRDQIKQVLLNLVLNALDVMPNGGMLTVTTRMDDTVRAQRAVPLQNNQILISISDTGSGISPEHQKKLFEPFFTTKPDGTGLGLSICRRIIEEHGGKIFAENEVSQGTTFTLQLPGKSR